MGTHGLVIHPEERVLAAFPDRPSENPPAVVHLGSPCPPGTPAQRRGSVKVRKGWAGLG